MSPAEAPATLSEDVDAMPDPRALIRNVEPSRGSGAASASPVLESLLQGAAVVGAGYLTHHIVGRIRDPVVRQVIATGAGVGLARAAADKASSPLARALTGGAALGAATQAFSTLPDAADVIRRRLGYGPRVHLFVSHRGHGAELVGLLVARLQAWGIRVVDYTVHPWKRYPRMPRPELFTRLYGQIARSHAVVILGHPDVLRSPFTRHELDSAILMGRPRILVLPQGVTRNHVPGYVLASVTDVCGWRAPAVARRLAAVRG